MSLTLYEWQCLFLEYRIILVLLISTDIQLRKTVFVVVFLVIVVVVAVVVVVVVEWLTDRQKLKKRPNWWHLVAQSFNTSADFVFWCGCNWNHSHPRPRTITRHDAHDFLHGSHRRQSARVSRNDVCQIRVCFTTFVLAGSREGRRWIGVLRSGLIACM